MLPFNLPEFSVLEQITQKASFNYLEDWNKTRKHMAAMAKSQPHNHFLQVISGHTNSGHESYQSKTRRNIWEMGSNWQNPFGFFPKLQSWIMCITNHHHSHIPCFGNHTLGPLANPHLPGRNGPHPWTNSKWVVWRDTSSSWTRRPQSPQVISLDLVDLVKHVGFNGGTPI